MDSKVLIDGLISVLGLIILFTFHEFGHSWMAWKCGDPTSKDDGRCSLNPLVHIDPIGSIIVPLVMVFSGSGMLLGWAKPVPVNLNNLRNPKLDDILISLAGPWMNLLQAVLLIGLARAGLAFHSENMTSFCFKTAQLSLLLVFFNLLPIPPLDGSRVLRALVGMSYETYYQFARYGFIVLIVVIQLQPVQLLLRHATDSSFRIIASWFGLV